MRLSRLTAHAYEVMARACILPGNVPSVSAASMDTSNTAKCAKPFSTWSRQVEGDVGTYRVIFESISMSNSKTERMLVHHDGSTAFIASFLRMPCLLKFARCIKES